MNPALPYNPTISPQRRPLRHVGPCGRREPCWRPGCQAAFPGLATIELLADGAVFAYCHHSTFRPVGFRQAVP